MKGPFSHIHNGPPEMIVILPYFIKPSTPLCCYANPCTQLISAQNKKIKVWNGHYYWAEREVGGSSTVHRNSWHKMVAAHFIQPLYTKYTHLLWPVQCTYGLDHEHLVSHSFHTAMKKEKSWCRDLMVYIPSITKCKKLCLVMWRDN